MQNPNHADLPEPPQILAFVCDRDSRIESLAVMPGTKTKLQAGALLLTEVTLRNSEGISELLQ